MRSFIICPFCCIFLRGSNQGKLNEMGMLHARARLEISIIFLVGKHGRR